MARPWLRTTSCAGVPPWSLWCLLPWVSCRTGKKQGKVKVMDVSVIKYRYTRCVNDIHNTHTYLNIYIDIHMCICIHSVRLSICMCQVYAHINKTYMEYRMVSNNTMPMCRSIKTIDLPKLGMAHQFLGVIRSIAKLRVWKAFQWGSVSSKGHSSSISRWFFGLDLLQFSNYLSFFRSPQGPDYSCRIWMGQFAGHP